MPERERICFFTPSPSPANAEEGLWVKEREMMGFDHFLSRKANDYWLFLKRITRNKYLFLQV